jgi:hypothetical protein
MFTAIEKCNDLQERIGIQIEEEENKNSILRNKISNRMPNTIESGGSSD